MLPFFVLMVSYAEIVYIETMVDQPLDYPYPYIEAIINSGKFYAAH